jgi:hypothetical protein
MKSLKKEFLSDMKEVIKAETKGAGAMLVEILIEVLLFVALVPSIVTGVTALEGNATGTEAVIYTIVPLLLSLALLFMIGKTTGVIKGKK